MSNFLLYDDLSVVTEVTKQRKDYCLTLNMLNCSKDYKRFVHILNRILDLA